MSRFERFKRLIFSASLTNVPKELLKKRYPKVPSIWTNKEKVIEEIRKRNESVCKS